MIRLYVFHQSQIIRSFITKNHAIVKNTLRFNLTSSYYIHARVEPLFKTIQHDVFIIQSFTFVHK